MASSPRWKIYSKAGVYLGCMKHIEDAARVVAGMDGWTIRDNHRRIVWTEGSEEIWAGESYDVVAETVFARIDGGGR